MLEDSLRTQQTHDKNLSTNSLRNSTQTDMEFVIHLLRPTSLRFCELDANLPSQILKDLIVTDHEKHTLRRARTTCIYMVNG